MSNSALRRRAAWTTLQPHLDDHNCMAALWLLENEHPRSDTASLLNYIDAVVERYHLADDLRQKLYFTYFEFLKNPDRLSQPDPLPLMQRHNAAIETPPPPSNPAPPQEATPTERDNNGESQTSDPPEAKRQTRRTPPIVSHKMVVFDYMITRLLQDYPGDSNELFGAVMANTSEYNVPVTAIQALHQWMSSPKTYLWRETFDTGTLSLIVHIFYVALCELMGPVAADKLWHRVLEAVEAIPEARSFPPRNFF